MIQNRDLSNQSFSELSFAIQKLGANDLFHLQKKKMYPHLTMEIPQIQTADLHPHHAIPQVKINLQIFGPVSPEWPFRIRHPLHWHAQQALIHLKVDYRAFFHSEDPLVLVSNLVRAE